MGDDGCSGVCLAAISGNSAAQEEKNDLVAQSQEKLQAVAQSLSPWLAPSNDGDAGGGYCSSSSSSTETIRQLPCTTAEDAVGYRCRCAFQFVWSNDRKVHYAIRQNQVPIIADTFPVANLRIQKAMEALLEILNNTGRGPDSMSGDENCLRNHLTSVSFSSSWNDDPSASSDCIATLHYDKAIEDSAAWKLEAQKVCSALTLTQLTGRSRKRVTVALDAATNAIIRDTVWIWQNGTQPLEWKAAVNKPRDDVGENGGKNYSVHYEKPEGAFFHPNARAMCRALEWILSCVSQIASATNISDDRWPRMLELYCGCGAHTVALLNAGILDKIVAVEYDERLVKACRRNVALNQTCTAGHGTDERNFTTPVDIVLADAAVWARDNSRIHNFDVLLVDPPRQGLDERVCRMAMDGPFQHLFYISCGREALVRDLALLSTAFRVVDCTLLDLFPQTDAVESLVHLERRT